MGRQVEQWRAMVCYWDLKCTVSANVYPPTKTAAASKGNAAIITMLGGDPNAKPGMRED